MGRKRHFEFTMFPLSKPFGYLPPAVEKKIKEYEDAIKKLNDALMVKDQEILKLQKRLEHTQNELRNLHLEMSNLELPDTTEIMEHQILEDFTRYNSGPTNDVEIHPPVSLPTPKHNNIMLNRTKGKELPKDVEGFDNDDSDDNSPFVIIS